MTHHSSLFEQRRSTPSGKKLRSAQGEIVASDFSDFSESDFAETYKSGHNGLRGSNVRNERKVVQESGEFRFSELADGSQMKVRVTPEQRNLVKLLGDHAEPDGFNFTEGQVIAARKFFGNQKNVNAANELVKLRSIDRPMTHHERLRRMKLEAELGKMRSALVSSMRGAA